MDNKHKKIITHLLIWALMFLYINLSAPFPKEIIPRLICNGLKILNYMFVFYALYYIVFQRFWEKNSFLLIISALVVYLSFTYFLYQINENVFPFFGRANVFKEKPSHILFLFSFYFFALAGGFAVSLFINKYSLYKLKIQSNKQNALIRKEIFILKNQFNSHITFNFLNYIYSHVLEISEKAAKPIEMYADMLRYTLSINPEKKVTLQQEIDYIKNFIEIQKLLSNKVYVKLTIKGELENKYIIPRLLITLVENAFSHGQFNNPNKPINIKLISDQSKIDFEIRNSIKNKKPDKSGGIGLNNLKEILELFYKDSYELILKHSKKEYIAKLSISIS